MEGENLVKRVIEAQVDETLFEKLKVLAARQRRSIDEIIEAALTDYVNRRERKSGRRSGLLRFLESRPTPNLTSEQLRETMEADFYDQ